MLVATLFSLITIGLISPIHGWSLLPYNPKASPDSIVTVTNARFTVISHRLIRMEYDPNNLFEDRASMTIVNRYNDLSNNPFNYSVNSSILTIETNFLSLKYMIGTDFVDSGSLTVSSRPTIPNVQFVYRPSGSVMRDNSWSGNLFGTIKSLDEINSPISLNCSENADIRVHDESLHCAWSPFGRQGYAVINDTETAMFETDWISQQGNANTHDWYFIGSGTDYKGALAEFRLISGAIPLVPRYSLGSYHCRWYDYSDRSLKSAVRNYESRQLPLDVAVIDMDWHVYGPWGAYTYNKHLFPTPSITQRWFTNKGLRTSANVHDDNGIQTFEEFYSEAAANLGINSGENIPFNVTWQKYMMTLEDIVMNPISQRDFSSSDQLSRSMKDRLARKERNEHRSLSAKELVEFISHHKSSKKDAIKASEYPYNDGFDFWWIDWQQGGQSGVGYSTINTDILLNYVRATDHIRRNENERGMVLSRWGGYGNHRYQVGFSGDVGHNWDMLAFEVYFTLTASNVGYGYWSHDIMGAANDYELDTRWTQWGAYSPIFRTHDAGGGTGNCVDTPNGCPAVDIFDHPIKYFNIERKALQERQSLLPYFYNYSRCAFETGVSMMRPVYFEYPLIEESYQMGSEYLLGESLLISPVTKSAGGSFNLTNWPIWVPPGQWYERHSGKWQDGGSSGMSMTRDMDLSEVPFYVKDGAILVKQPFNSREILGRANRASYDRLEFAIHLSPASLSQAPSDGLIHGYTRLYEDDGISYNYLVENSFTMYAHTQVTFSYNVSDGQFIGNIETIGNYDGFVTDRIYSFMLPNMYPVKFARCGNIQLPFLDVSQWYDQIGSNDHLYGWYYDGDEMAIVLVCPRVSTDSRLTVSAQFDWDQNNLINGIRGKINRAYLSKNALDAQNINYGADRNNLTDAAGAGLFLSNLAGNDPDSFESLVNGYANLFNSAINQVQALSGVDYNRHRYAIQTLVTI